MKLERVLGDRFDRSRPTWATCRSRLSSWRHRLPSVVADDESGVGRVQKSGDVAGHVELAVLEDDLFSWVDGEHAVVEMVCDYSLENVHVNIDA